MNDVLYKVVFSGRLVPGVSGRQALANLSKISKRSPDEIRSLFSRPGRVLRRNLSLAKAEGILADLMRAGVVCQIQEVPLKVPEIVPTAPVVETSRILSVVEDGPNILTLVPVTPDSTLTPIDCGFLAAVDGGLETSRLDRSFIAYADILAATLFAPERGSNKLMLLLYSVGNKRPLIINGAQISFSVFPDVPNEDFPTSLSNFLYFLAAQNSGFCVDEKTDLFMAGVDPDLFCANQLLLAYGVYAALSETHENLDRAPLPAPPPGAAAALRPVKQFAAEQDDATEDPLEFDDPIGFEIIRGIDQRAELESWVDRWPWFMVMLLLAGLFVPQLKHNVLSDSNHLVWFWELLGVGIDSQQKMLEATCPNTRLVELCTLMPLISAVLVLLSQFAMPKRWRGPTLFVAGFVPLTLAFTLLQSSGGIYGIMFLPTSVSIVCLALLFLLSFLLIAAVNRLSKQAIVHPQLNFLQRMAGVTLLLLIVLAIVGVDWNNVDQHVANVIEYEPGVVPQVIASIKALLGVGGMAMSAGVGLVQMLGRQYAGR